MGGKLVEFPYTQGISSSKLISLYKDIGTTPDTRRKQLKRILSSKKYQVFRYSQWFKWPYSRK